MNRAEREAEAALQALRTMLDKLGRRVALETDPGVQSTIAVAHIGAILAEVRWIVAHSAMPDQIEGYAARIYLDREMAEMGAEDPS